MMSARSIAVAIRPKGGMLVFTPVPPGAFKAPNDDPAVLVSKGVIFVDGVPVGTVEEARTHDPKFDATRCRWRIY